MPPIRLKVSGISSLTDARYCAGMGVSYLSFRTDGKQPVLSPTEFTAIRGWIEGVEWLGEYEGPDADRLKELAETYDVKTWVVREVAFLRDPDLAESGLSLVLRIPESDPAWQAGYPHLEIELENPEEPLNPRMAVNAAESMRILRNPGSVSRMVELHRQYPDLIFNLESGEEERPGWMDLSQLQDVLEELEEKGLSL